MVYREAGIPFESCLQKIEKAGKIPVQLPEGNISDQDLEAIFQEHPKFRNVAFYSGQLGVILVVQTDEILLQGRLLTKNFRTVASVKSGGTVTLSSVGLLTTIGQLSAETPLAVAFHCVFPSILNPEPVTVIILDSVARFREAGAELITGGFSKGKRVVSHSEDSVYVFFTL